MRGSFAPEVWGTNWGTKNHVLWLISASDLAKSAYTYPHIAQPSSRLGLITRRSQVRILPPL
jgi:hypothetical protein